MKKVFLLASVIFLFFFSGCAESLQKRIDELHHESMQLNTAFKPIMEELNQKAISINIQGRALTQDEMNFVGAVFGLESDHNKWLIEMEEVLKLEHGEKRLGREQAIHASIVILKKKAGELIAKK
jgi:SMC interacting uncharacterized protein involved in chromosome segregation